MTIFVFNYYHIIILLLNYVVDGFWILEEQERSMEWKHTIPTTSYFGAISN
ncbi:hypothetical protein ACJX0J_007034, partial [Zea mays]